MAELKFTKSHEWVKVNGSKAKIGITDYAQNELGDIVFVELPQAGTEIKKGKSFGVIESVKVASDLNAPLSGKVVKINEQLQDKPQLVNEDPYGKGWMIEIEIEDKTELNELLDENGYKEMI